METNGDLEAGRTWKMDQGICEYVSSIFHSISSDYWLTNFSHLLTYAIPMGYQNAKLQYKLFIFSSHKFMNRLMRRNKPVNGNEPRGDMNRGQGIHSIDMDNENAVLARELKQVGRKEEVTGGVI